jgi:hypothetical protein
MAVAQLFSFEDYGSVFAGMWLPGGADMASLYAAVIVILEVGAVPFLLMMFLSRAMRVLSMMAAWAAVIFWFVVTVAQNGSKHIIANDGMLGATVPLPVGWWAVLFSIALGIMAAWAAWGMWPLKSGRKRDVYPKG